MTMFAAGAGADSVESVVVVEAGRGEGVIVRGEARDPCRRRLRGEESLFLSSVLHLVGE